MAVSSMTGFARAAASGGGWRWTFELKTVNAKGLDIRLRMPAPFDQVEGEARRRLAKALARGTCFANLSTRREAATTAARIDAAALESIAVAARAAAAKAGLAPPTMDGLLALRGVVDAADAEDDEAAVDAACAGALTSLDEAIACLTTARRQEGGALASVLKGMLQAIGGIVEAPTPIRRGGRRRCASALPRASRR
jgi:uncharacterized protein (TIGR00255 family)